MKRTWLLIAGGFLLLIAAWSSLIIIAAKYSPQTVELSR